MITAIRDSVFGTMVQDAATPYPDDRPLIPTGEITAALDRIEESRLADLLFLVERQHAMVVAQGMAFLARGDAESIRIMRWNLSVTLQKPIYQTWQDGWAVGNDHAIAEIKAGLPRQYSHMRRYAQTEQEKAIANLIKVSPAVLENSGAIRDVQQRALQIAGGFSDDQLNAVKGHLISAIAPDANGKVISRAQLEASLQATLNVSKSRATAIARTELTNAYNTSRVETMLSSSMVTHVRFLAISDARTTAICRSRNGMLIPVADRAAIAANKPPLHVKCRSVLSPVMARQNPTHAKWAADPGRDYQARELAPTPKGWKVGALPEPPPPPKPDPVPEPPAKKTPARTRKPKVKPEASAIDATSPKALIAHGKTFVDTSGMDSVIATGKAEMDRLQAALDAILESGLDARTRLDARQAIADYRKEYARLLQDEAIKVRRTLLESGMAEKKAVSLAKKIKIDLPAADQKIIRDEMVRNFQLTGGKGATAKKLKITGPRAYAHKADGYINMGDVAGETILHELGHFVEFESSDVQVAAMNFIYGRATGAPQKLNELTNTNNYGDFEIALPDKFISPYVGKVYSSGDTEVVSMGLERLYSARTLAEFYQADPDHFFFTIGVIRR